MEPPNPNSSSSAAAAGDDDGGAVPPTDQEKLETLIRRLTSGPVAVRVHDLIIKGNTKTKETLIESEVSDAFAAASTMQELVYASQVAGARLQKLDVFDKVSITLDAGPVELPGTANVVIEVVEAKNPAAFNFGVYSRPEAKGWSLDGSLKYKNLLGYGDIWDATGSYAGDKASDISAGVSFPRFKALPTPVMARLFLSNQDWLKYSSYKERDLGISLGLFSTNRHDLAYDLTWRRLTDPSHMCSKSTRRQLGHSLLSSLRYSYKIDKRDSPVRPTYGYAFSSKSQVGGLGLDSKSFRFIRQELDLRGAYPLGIFNAALNVGVAAGVVVPLGGGFMKAQSSLPERFFMGGHSSPVCGLGLVSLLGLESRGVGPTDSRRTIPSTRDTNVPTPSPGNDANVPTPSPGSDALGGDLAVTTFADLSFDLPFIKLFGIHGHAFVNAGNLARLTGGEFRNFTPQNFLSTFRGSTGFGLVVPTKLFRMEINYCYILKKFENDRGKTGIQVNFSSSL